MRRVLVDLDTSKIPCKTRPGYTLDAIHFRGGRFFDADQAAEDAVYKAANHLQKKYGLHIIDRSYGKLVETAKKCKQDVLQINEMNNNLTSVMTNWKATIDHLGNLQKAMSHNKIRLEVATRLIEIKNETTASFKNVKENIVGAKHEHDFYTEKYNEVFPKETNLAVEIPARDILGDIMGALGLKKPTFSNTVVRGDKLRLLQAHTTRQDV